MNSNQPFESDEQLRKVLSEWQVDAALPPRFQEQVWKRIDSVEKCAPTLWTLIRNWTATTLTRPALAMAYIAILLLIGATVGYQQGESKTAQVKSDLQARYVQMVDPYKIPR